MTSKAPVFPREDTTRLNICRAVITNSMTNVSLHIFLTHNWIHRVYTCVYNTWVTRGEIDTLLDFLHSILALDQPFSSRLRPALKRFTRKARSSRRENDARQTQPPDKAFPSLSSCSSASRFYAAYTFFLFRPLLQSCSSMPLTLWTALLDRFLFFFRDILLKISILISRNLLFVVFPEIYSTICCFTYLMIYLIHQ